MGAARKVSPCVPVSGEISVSSLSTAAMVEELRHVSGPSTVVGLDPVFRNHPDIDFRNAVFAPSIGSSISTVSTTSV